MPQLFIAVMLMFSITSALAQTVTLRDWQASCDAYRNCIAILDLDADPTDYLTADYRISFARDAHDTYWSVSLTTYATTPRANAPVDISIDGETIRLASIDEFDAFGALNAYFLLDKNGQNVVDMMIVGSSVEFIFTDNNDIDQNVTFSLSGLAAALLWIDEKQNRIGSERVIDAPTNLMRVTDRTPHSLPDDFANRAAAGDCEPLDSLVHGDDGESHRLDAERTIHLIPCQAGAYNFAYQVYLQSDDNIRQLLFADYSQRQGWGGTNLLINAFYDPRGRTLSAYYKGRGIGDCGTTGLWQWDEWDFRLLEFTAKSECDGEGFPAEFPIVFRAPDYDPIELD